MVVWDALRILGNKHCTPSQMIATMQVAGRLCLPYGRNNFWSFLRFPKNNLQMPGKNTRTLRFSVLHTPYTRQLLSVPNSPNYGIGARRYYSSSSSDSGGSNSFIKAVLQQVKREMESNEELRKSVEELRKSGVIDQSSNLKQKVIDHASAAAETASAAAAAAVSAASRTAAAVSKAKESSSAYIEQLRESNPAVRAAAEAGAAVVAAGKKVADVAATGVETIVDTFKDEKAVAAKQKAEKWRRDMEERRSARQRVEQGQCIEGEVNPDYHDASNGEYALVLAQESAWDRFGTRLKDMPFLLNFFENPVVGKLFGESQQAAAIREMKVADPSFRLPELVDLVQHVIAPHLLDCFLRGDKEPLKRQCGQAAFAAVEHSINEREVMKLALDPSILLLRNVEFKSAATVPDSLPWFIFTFTAQQINCMRDKDDNVVVGAIDDIREVIYSIALVKHPDPEAEELEYPWQVSPKVIDRQTKIGFAGC